MNNPHPHGKPGPIGKFFAFLAGAILLVAGLLFSVVLLAVVAIAGAVILGYFWWKTRALRKAMRENAAGGVVIDGEVIVVDERDSDRSLEVDVIEDKRPPRSGS